MKFVDTREPESRWKPLCEAGFVRKKLDAGDVEFLTATGETVLIEHKTVALLLQDMSDGTLANQCQRVAGTANFPVLMVEGTWTQANGCLMGTRYTWEQAWNQLQTLQDLGLRLQITTGPAHTIARILQLAEYYGKDAHHSLGRHPSGDPWVGTLCQISGVGTKRAKILLEWAGSLEGVATASLEALQALPGIPQGTARQVYQFWRVRNGQKR